jgi:8-oxo-dGTP pyrophosphatase MutT (NUDIX family)
MNQRYKVYFANRPVIFAHVEDVPEDLRAIPGSVLITSRGKMDVPAIESAIASGAKIILLLCDHTSDSFRAFKNHFNLLTAAGGVVLNSSEEMLFIFRHQKWDLPKGKVEDDETPEIAAVREISEECGIQTNIISPLTESWHTYIQSGEPIIKRTIWFVMSYDGKGNIIPQREEGITQIIWKSDDDLSEIYSNTYASVQDVCEAYLSFKNLAPLS